jgi:hypothetical protein
MCGVRFLLEPMLSAHCLEKVFVDFARPLNFKLLSCPGQVPALDIPQVGDGFISPCPDAGNVSLSLFHWFSIYGLIDGPIADGAVKLVTGMQTLNFGVPKVIKMWHS